MDKAALVDLFERLLAASRVKEQASTKLEVFQLNHLKPEQPKIVTDLDQWQTYLDAVIDYEAQLAAHKTIYHEANLMWTGLQSKAISELPSRVWFKYGEVGIGIGYTNWGGSRHYVVISPWQDDMPSLDHTYHGD